jgi:hypothetical protein
MGIDKERRHPKWTRLTPQSRTSYEAIVPNPKLKLMDQVREVMRLKHYSIGVNPHPEAFAQLTEQFQKVKRSASTRKRSFRSLPRAVTPVPL